MSRFAEVAPFAPVLGRFHYSIPEKWQDVDLRGMRVVVPFGSRSLAGVVVAQTDEIEIALDKVKPISQVEPQLNTSAELMELCQWVAGYYRAPLGEVLRVASPPGSRRGTEKQVAKIVKLEKRDPWADVWVKLSRELNQDDHAWLRKSKVRKNLHELLVAGEWLSAKALFAGAPRMKTALEQMREREFIVAESRPEIPQEISSRPPPVLTAEQRTALTSMQMPLAEGVFRGFLLHGVTGSGKTEVYLHLIADALSRGKTAIVLVPEISLTPQLAGRFRERFGAAVAVLHSGLSDNQRFAEWQRLHSGQARIAVGARSAVFAPVQDLGVIVVDEEHDGSFKQEDGVKYHARDVALVRCQKSKAVCVLGSATPSLESFYGSEQGRLVRLTLIERATGGELPEVTLINLREYQPSSESLISAPLMEAMQRTLERGEQVILFYNRRGFSTFVLCIGCGHQFHCPQCSVSLTYHRKRDALVCHYCSHHEIPPVKCPKCQAAAIVKRGIGTEKVTEAIRELFPKARLARLDRDSVTPIQMAQVLGRVANQEIDVLIGTQMVTKGHDFPYVTLVGVLCADVGLSLPDFRAQERTFQLLAQVAGRAGRGHLTGKVIVQTYRPDNPALHFAKTHDYLSFYRHEVASRRELGYPPSGHLVAIRVDGGELKEVISKSNQLAAQVRAAFSPKDDVAILGPCESPIARIKNRYRWQLWLRARDRKMLWHGLSKVMPEQGRLRVSVDVDPQLVL